MIVVGDSVGDVGDLRLESRLGSLDKPAADIAKIPGVFDRAVFEDALAGFEHQVEPGKIGVLGFETIDNAQ